VKRFWKLNALGNNFVFTIHEQHVDYAELAPKICVMMTGIGADGLLTIDWQSSPPTIRMWNPDGTTDFCGNGLCCAAHLLHFLGYDHLDSLGTPIRQVPIRIEPINKSASLVSIGMERGTFDPRLVPLLIEHATPAQLGYDIAVNSEIVRVYPVNNGNMHSVIFVEQLPVDEIFFRLGPLIENHPIFPYRTNVLWCVLKNDEVQMRVWERGVGETLSCGTGSAAVFSVCERLSLLIGGSISVVTKGGVTKVEIETEGVFLKTRAQLTFEGLMIDDI
jgi:diaminopimelate epimerase